MTPIGFLINILLAKPHGFARAKETCHFLTRLNCSWAHPDNTAHVATVAKTEDRPIGYSGSASERNLSVSGTRGTAVVRKVDIAISVSAVIPTSMRTMMRANVIP